MEVLPLPGAPAISRACAVCGSGGVIDDEMHLSHKKSGGVNSRPDRFSIVNDISLSTEISVLSYARPG